MHSPKSSRPSWSVGETMTDVMAPVPSHARDRRPASGAEDVLACALTAPPRETPSDTAVDTSTATSIVTPREREASEKRQGEEVLVDSAKGSVTYCHRGIRHVGQYEVVGLTMTLICDLGTFRVPAGQANPRKFARHLLQSVCKRAALSKGAPDGS